MWKNIKEILKKEYYVREIITLFVMVLSMLSFIVYESLAIFAGSMEKSNIASIQTGLITFNVTSSDSAYNSSTKQITIPANTKKIFNIDITNTTSIDAKYKVYYKLITPSTLPSGVTIVIREKTNSSYDTGILKTNEITSKEIVITNTSSSSITLEIGVEGGYSNNTLTLSSEHSALSFEQLVEPNAPKLATGMIPVVYDETSSVWKVADTSKEWYNYDKQMWANAVTVNESESLEINTNSVPGTPIPMDKINSMWVWIPRYKYVITSNIGSSSNITSPPQIDVIFESGTGTTGQSLANCSIDSTTCYYTHPSFRNGSSVYTTTAYDQGGWSSELTGFWVGKFETGGSATTPLIKPDISSLRSQDISTQFLTSLKFAGGTMNTLTGEVTFSGNKTYGLTSTTDTHMMKNTEWGAVAYLSQSRYGKMGNANYTGTNKEIYINNSSEYYTGRSGGSPSATSSTYGTYSYNGKSCSAATCTGTTNLLSGTGASTTGTIYGIYDMSGGSYELTMANLNQYSGYSSTNCSGFNGILYTGGTKTDGISFPIQKYYDEYSGNDSSNVKDKSIKGDATYETMKWYSDFTDFIVTIGPWFHRGGYNSPSTNYVDGVFYHSKTTGASYATHSFRTILIP